MSTTCEHCRHFRPDRINPHAGLGSCAKQHLARYPAQPHYCRDHEEADKGEAKQR